MKSISLLAKTIKLTDQPMAIFLVGPPGSGKSTWLKENRIDQVVISTDDILEAWGAELGLNYSEAFREADLKNIEQQMYANLEKSVSVDCNIIIDRTNMSQKVRAKILRRIPEYYAKFAIVFIVTRDELTRRLENREATTGKHIPAFVVENMVLSFEMPTTDEFDEVFI